MIEKTYSWINSSLIYCIIFFIVIILKPSIVFSENLKAKAWISTETNKVFSFKNSQYISSDKSIGFQTVNNFSNITTNLTLNYNNKHSLTFDQSSIEYKNKNKIFGIGKINRNWSFSPNTSLVLSTNARPPDSIYFLFENPTRSKNIFFSWLGPSSIEFFNSFTSSQIDKRKSMFTGTRFVIEPVQNFKFEFFKTSQLGGEDYNEDLSSFFAAMIGNTNESPHSNVNQMAGFGISYLTSIMNRPLRVYSQFAGEDESGNLPSCFIKMIGNELKLPEGKLFSKVGFEYIDTRVDFTSNNNCGPNAAYNNSIYPYTNYGSTMGAPIDSESKSYNIWASTKISEKININYSIKNITVNDSNWSQHRLSSNKKNGWQTDIETSWKNNSYNLKGRLTYQNFSLDKINYKPGLNINLNMEYKF